MRRFVAIAALVVILVPGHAHAKAWPSFRSTHLAFSLQYPPGWRVTGSPTVGPVSFQSGIMGVNVQLLPMRPATNIKQTVQQVIRTDSTYARVHWTRTTLGGRPAMIGVDSPPTEGGVSLSDGIYITGWRSRVYVIIFTAYHKPAIRRLSQFPAVYHQIFRTWRFL